MTNSAFTPRAESARWRAVVAWVVILLLVAFIMVARQWPEIRGRKRPAQEDSWQVEVTGKYLIGVKAAFPQAATQPSFTQKLGSQFDQMSKTPEDAIRAAALAGEFEGRKAALKRLGKISASTQPGFERDLESMESIYETPPEHVEADQRRDLIDHYGFFGKLALSHGLREKDPLRAEVLGAGERVLIVLASYAGLMLVLLIAGLVLMTIAIVMRAMGRMESRIEAPVNANSAYLEAFAIYLALFTLLPIPLYKFLNQQNLMFLSWAMLGLLPLGMWWAHWRGSSWEEVRRAFGWYGGRGWWIEAPLGIVGYIAGLPVLLVGILITGFLIRISGANASHPIMNELRGSKMHILGIYLLACVFAPVMEESMFRGALFAHLRRRWGWAMSAFPVALIFAAIHPQGWAAIPLLGSVALVLAAIREWRGSIIASMVCHACVNFGTLTLVVLLMN